jgi:mRNA interferase HigB
LTYRSHYGTLKLADARSFQHAKDRADARQARLEERVSHKAIRTFCARDRDSESPLDHWYRVAKRATWVNFVEVKRTFNTADFVAPYVIFDIGGNKYRLVAEINFGRRVLFIRGIMTHKEYAKGAWKP